MTPESLAEIAGASAYAAGFVANVALVQHGAKKREAAIAELNAALPVESTTVPEPGAPERIGRFVTGKVLAAGAVLAGVSAATAVLGFEADAPKMVKPTIEVVVDHSGAAPVAEINKVVAEFGNTDKLHSQALVATSGQVRDLNIDKVSADMPFGDAPLDDAVRLALDKTTEIMPTSFEQGHRQGAGVLVITNGNSIGAPDAVVTTAKESLRTPVFVVNVEGTANSAAAAQLKAIAQQTHAKYWDATKANLSDISKEVQTTITEYETAGDKNPGRDLLRAISVISGLGALAAFANARYQVLRKNPNGK